MIDPIKTCCQKTLTFIKFNPLRSSPIINTPAKTPNTVPLPPKKLAPPIITAAMASSSDCKPAFGYPVLVLPTRIMAPMPDKKPHRVYTRTKILLTLIPAARAASGLPPIAKIHFPILV